MRAGWTEVRSAKFMATVTAKYQNTREDMAKRGFDGLM